MILTCKRSSIHLYPLFILSAYGKFYPNITKNISNGELNWSCLAYFWWVLPCHTNFKNFRKFSLQWNNSFFFFFYLVFFISKSFLWFSPRSLDNISKLCTNNTLYILFVSYNQTEEVANFYINLFPLACFYFSSIETNTPQMIILMNKHYDFYCTCN